MLERGEGIDEVGCPVLLAGPLAADEIGGLAALHRDLRPPLAVPAVEDQDRLAGLQAQDVQEVIGLRPVEGDLAPSLRGASTKRRGALKSYSAMATCAERLAALPQVLRPAEGSGRMSAW